MGRLAAGRLERREIVLAYETGARALHRGEIERFVHVPRGAPLDRRRPAIVPDAIAIVAQPRVAARVEIFRRGFDAPDGDVARRHAVEAALQSPEIDLSAIDEIRHLAERVHARVGAAGA